MMKGLRLCKMLPLRPIAQGWPISSRCPNKLWLILLIYKGLQMEFRIFGIVAGATGGGHSGSILGRSGRNPAVAARSPASVFAVHLQLPESFCWGLD